MTPKQYILFPPSLLNSLKMAPNRNDMSDTGGSYEPYDKIDRS